MIKLFKMTIQLISVLGLAVSLNDQAEASQNFKAEPVKQVQSDSSQTSQKSAINDLPKSAKVDDSILILVNNKNRLKEDLDLNLVTLKSGYTVNEVMAEDLEELLEAAEAEGYPLATVSAYRSISAQYENRRSSIQSYLNQGLSEEEAVAFTNEYIAPSNGSEHSTGLAIDLLGVDWIGQGGGLTGDFGGTESAKWLAENCQDYGFILRYPEGKEKITGYQYEPWHFRYVGKENAQYIMDNDLILEEYLDLIKEKEATQAKEAEKARKAEETKKVDSTKKTNKSRLASLFKW